MQHELHVVTSDPRPTAVVARATTWNEFPSLWKDPAELESEVYYLLS